MGNETSDEWWRWWCWWLFDTLERGCVLSGRVNLNWLVNLSIGMIASRDSVGIVCLGLMNSSYLPCMK